MVTLMLVYDYDELTDTLRVPDAAVPLVDALISVEAGARILDVSENIGTDDSDGDDEDRSFSQILSVWGAFPSGTCNHCASESGDSGRNVEDYVYRAAQWSWWFSYEKGHNCLDDQEG